jgi:hypothetical protein
VSLNKVTNALGLLLHPNALTSVEMELIKEAAIPVMMGTI